jgi:hypothetical protein
MPLVFTNEFIESLKPAGNPFERAYIAQLAKDTKAAALRDRIEALLAKYPEDNRDVMITQIRSVSDIECRSNLAELYVYGNLIEHFKVVQVEPPLSFLDNKTPDFWVDDRAAFEVATLFEEDDPNYFAIVETLNSLTGNIKLILSHCTIQTPDKTPRLKPIREFFADLFAKKADITKPESFLYRSPDVIIAGNMYRGDPAHPTVGSIIKSYTSSDGSDYQKAVRRVVKRKLAKYKKLAEAKRSLAIVLYNLNDWLDLDDFDEIFFGSVAFDVDWDTRRPNNLRREGAVMNPAFNRSLSAVLVKDIGQLNRYFLIENPWA